MNDETDPEHGTAIDLAADVDVLALDPDDVAGITRRIHKPDFTRADATINGPRRAARKGAVQTTGAYRHGVFTFSDTTTAAFLSIEAGHPLDPIGQNEAVLIAEEAETGRTRVPGGRVALHSGNPGPGQPVELLLLTTSSARARRNLARALRGLARQIEAHSPSDWNVPGEE